MDDSSKYQGQELILFENAINWKKYLFHFIHPHINGKVLECGAGIGATTKILNKGSANDWILLEPDREMVIKLKNKILTHELPSNCQVTAGNISTFENIPLFDTILYIDVLEHIEKDKIELESAASRLKQNGKLIILSPAFPSLYSNFDKAIGHFRRYTKKELASIIPEKMNQLSLRYLDTSGFLLSFANKILLKQKYPTQKQIKLWDTYMIPVSKISDSIFNYSFGKSILGIWEKT